MNVEIGTLGKVRTLRADEFAALVVRLPYGPAYAQESPVTVLMFPRFPGDPEGNVFIDMPVNLDPSPHSYMAVNHFTPNGL